MPKLPDLNPLLAPNAFCSTCGELMGVEVDHGPKGGAQGIIYFCQNFKRGCQYRVYSDARLNGQTKAWNPLVPEGTF